MIKQISLNNDTKMLTSKEHFDGLKSCLYGIDLKMVLCELRGLNDCLIKKVLRQKFYLIIKKKYLGLNDCLIKKVLRQKETSFFNKIQAFE